MTGEWILDLPFGRATILHATLLNFFLRDVCAALRCNQNLNDIPVCRAAPKETVDLPDKPALAFQLVLRPRLRS